jgi:hypothetical protein
LATLCEGLLLRCRGKPFSVRIIKASLMATPMTEVKAPPALCASSESVEQDLLRRPNRWGIEYLPWWWQAVMQIKGISSLDPNCRLESDLIRPLLS